MTIIQKIEIVQPGYSLHIPKNWLASGWLFSFPDDCLRIASVIHSREGKIRIKIMQGEDAFENVAMPGIFSGSSQYSVPDAFGLVPHRRPGIVGDGVVQNPYSPGMGIRQSIIEISQGLLESMQTIYEDDIVESLFVVRRFLALLQGSEKVVARLLDEPGIWQVAIVGNIELKFWIHSCATRYRHMMEGVPLADADL